MIYLDGALGSGLSGQRAVPALMAKFPRASIVYIGASGAVKESDLLAEGVSLVLPKPWNVAQLQDSARRGMAL